MPRLVLRHLAKAHRDLPHVVKFSGGRSSAAMLFMLLKAGLLDRARGDVVVFNNTSAEHPATYRFTRACKERAEALGIPFLWTQFQTYEDARGGEWTRLPSYRLVDSKPVSESNPQGFEWRGEVFEEMLSWSGYVPNRFTRTCTQWLKIETTKAFLEDWFSGEDSIPMQGHDGEESRVGMEAVRRRHASSLSKGAPLTWPSRCPEADREAMGAMHRRHRRHRGQLSEDVFERKRSYALSRPCFRPEQRWSDFSKVWNPFGARLPEHVSLLGIRADEPDRAQRIRERAALGGRGCGARSGMSPEIAGIQGEHPVMPLVEAEITRYGVNSFWDRQDWDLRLPQNGSLSNCVHCFMKGAKALKDVRRGLRPREDVHRLGLASGSPADVSWWRRMERTYGQAARDGSWIGFFGASKDDSYGIPSGALAMPCDCTE